jgi:ATP-dependent exoDNAse (exonuclease V) beta subunit
LIDYKTDYNNFVDEEVFIEAKKKKYAPQLAVYEEALNREYGTMGNPAVVEKYLYLITIGKFIQVP